MMDYVAPVRDMKFVISELVGFARIEQLQGFDEVSEDLSDAVLEEAAKLAQELLGPLNRVGDLELWIEIDVPFVLVVPRNRFTQLRQTTTQRIPVIPGIVRGFAELFDSDLRRRDIRVAEPQIDDVSACLRDAMRARNDVRLRSLRAMRAASWLPSA